MKIIKEFESNLKFSGFHPEDPRYYLIWGLGDDAELYFKGWRIIDHSWGWANYINSNGNNNGFRHEFIVPFSEMINITNKFKNLLPFI